MIPGSRVLAFVQARMTSRRFPGKVLAPFRGEPLLQHVVSRLVGLPDIAGVVVLTSVESSDDPVAAYAPTLGADVFRGPLDDVFQRFRLCAAARPCDYVLRISADSPLLSTAIVARVLDAADAAADVVTTVHPRTFPRGQNAELIRTAALMQVDRSELTNDDREHVTPFFYRHDDRYRIRAVGSGHPELANLNFAVDTLDDLRRLESADVPADLDQLMLA